jgi:hypothetical protein
VNGGDLVAATLEAHGVRFLFTLCGGHISPILVGAKQRQIRVVDVRHEATAVFAADAVIAKTMGFEPARLAQSWYGDLTGLGISDLDKIDVIGEDIDDVTVAFKPHETTDEQWAWSDQRLEKYLAA